MAQVSQRDFELKEPLAKGEHSQEDNGEIEMQPRTKNYNVIGKPLSWMLFVYLIAVTTGIGQHLFYSHVNGREPSSYLIPQPWVIRIGTAFASLFQMTLGASVGLVFAKACWFRFQLSALSVEGIDSVFTLCSDPKQLFAGEMIKKAKLVLLLALISWATQLTSILSPGSLTGVSVQGTFIDISG